MNSRRSVNSGHMSLAPLTPVHVPAGLEPDRFILMQLVNDRKGRTSPRLVFALIAQSFGHLMYSLLLLNDFVWHKTLELNYTIPSGLYAAATALYLAGRFTQDKPVEDYMRPDCNPVEPLPPQD